MVYTNLESEFEQFRDPVQEDQLFNSIILLSGIRLEFWDTSIYVNQMYNILELILVLTFLVWNNKSIQKIIWKSWAFMI